MRIGWPWALLIVAILVAAGLGVAYLDGRPDARTTGPARTPPRIVAFGIVTPFLPSGPLVRLTVEAGNASPLSNVSAVLTEDSAYTFTFANVTPSDPLAPGQQASATAGLIGGSIVCGFGYRILVRGAYSGGSGFEENLTAPLVCP